MDDRGLAVRGAAAPSWGRVVGGTLARRSGALLAMSAVGLVLLAAVGLAWGLVWLGLGRALQEPGASAPRWLALGLAQLAIPGAMVLLLPLVRRVVPFVLQSMAGAGEAGAGPLDRSVGERLEPGERILASMALDETFGPCQWDWSLVAVWTALTGALSVIVWAAGLNQVEPVMAAVYVPAVVVGLVLAAWVLQALVILDVVGELVIGGLPLALAAALWSIVPQGLNAAGWPLYVVLALQSLWVVARYISRVRASWLVLTTRGLRCVEGTRRSRSVDVGPVLRPVMISAGPAPLGERWLWSDEGGGSGLFFPVLASARSVARVAAQSGIELKVRPDARRASGANLSTAVGLVVLLLWYLASLLPPAHLSVSLALDLALRTDELSASPGPVMATCADLARQHPLALVPRCMGAQERALAGDPEGAEARFEEVEGLLALVPGVTWETLPRMVRELASSVRRDLALRRRVPLGQAEGWEPEGEALAPYRRAMLTLFGWPGWPGGAGAGRFTTVRRLLDEAHGLAPAAAGPRFMLAFLHLRHWDRGVPVEDSLYRLVEQASDAAATARKGLAPVTGTGPWAPAATALGGVRGLLTERQVALGLVVARVEEGKLSAADLALALSLLQARTDGDCVDGEAFGEMAVKPPSTSEEFLRRWKPVEGSRRDRKLGAAKLWRQAEGRGPLDETVWLPELLRELGLRVPTRLVPRVLSEPRLHWLRSRVARKDRTGIEKGG